MSLWDRRNYQEPDLDREAEVHFCGLLLLCGSLLQGALYTTSSIQLTVLQRRSLAWTLMPSRKPIAFLSYVRNDDDHDLGAITKLRERLEGEVKVQSGRPFEIFQDRNDIRWGQFWDERITDSLSEATFLIPIITPSFFQSVACRKEFDAFRKMEQTLGVPRLILPLYYVTCDQLGQTPPSDPIVKAIGERQWTDWRSFRFKPFDDHDVRSALATLASNIKSSISEINSIAVAASSARPVIESEKEINPDSTKVVVAKLPAVLPRIPQWIEAGRPPKSEYYVFTKKFDEIINAIELTGSPDDLLQSNTALSTEVRRFKKVHARLLKSLVSSRATAESIAVTLLLDNSGSLRGRPIACMAAWVFILDEWCESVGIKLEILGYTTRAWKGGQSRDLWLANGKPTSPGRLNDLRHIVYKSFEETSENSLARLSVMLREGLLKENIDGEALVWACDRLEKQGADKHILIVISDGAPVDDATLSVNPSNFLEKHLISMAEWLEAKPNLEFLPIGIGFKPKYYRDAQEVKPDEIGLPILWRLNALLQPAKEQQS
ncbi:cobaltochelatase CobT-related protein [Bradyrhizobium sp. 1050_B9_N1_2]|uniref:cobaltochelatase CobT-related protein n=1 Tax=Bradyrhizobium sp. 1050_B9_N1_2 TaxID=3238688 RepID=UPI003EDB7ACE